MDESAMTTSPSTMDAGERIATGTPQTREFYDRVGWTRSPDADRLVDYDLFGSREDGPIRQELYAYHLRRIRNVLWSTSDSLNFLECGCGGNPTIRMLRPGDRYTGVDFSATGLVEADKVLRAWGGTYALQNLDICRLEFADAQFDAVYSSHVLYHIDDAASQSAALAEMARVLRPGGVAVLHLANPRPLLFPIRLGMRLVADAPVLRSLAGRIRKKGLLPYRPMGIGWYRRELRRHGSVEVVTGGIPSVWFNRNVSERSFPGKILWQAVRSMETHAPRVSARLGNYFLLIFRKS
jgi:SAM-dependent methyltransferase